jgi:hypothetical protein
MSNIVVSVNLLSNSASNSSLGVSNVILSEEELSIEIRDFDVIIISDNYSSLW